MTSHFEQEQHVLTTKLIPKRAVAEGDIFDSGLTDMLNRGDAPSKDPNVMRENSADRIVNLEGRTKGFLYIPLEVSDADEAWERVLGALRTMKDNDFNEVEDDDGVSFDCFSLKYISDNFVLTRTRLVKLEEEDDQIFIELRKLEGCGFAFTDDYQCHIEEQLEDITVEDNRPKPQEKPTPITLDLTDETFRQEVVSNWFTNLRPTRASNNLVYNEIETFSAISSLAWNCSSSENFEILKDHSETIQDCTFNILNVTTHLPTAYFASRILSIFAENGQLNADWSHVKLMSSAMINWSEETGDEFAKIQVTRSREIVRLLSDTMIAVGPQLNPEEKGSSTGNLNALFEKLSELEDSPDYEGYFDLGNLATALSM